MYTYTFYAGDGATGSWSCDDLPTVIRRAAKDENDGLRRPMFVRGPDIFLDVFALRVVLTQVISLDLRLAPGMEIVKLCRQAAAPA